MPTVYETVNEYGDRVIVDEENGIVSPVEPLTYEELVDSGFVGLWKDRQDEIPNSAEYVRNMRDGETTRAWRKRKDS